MALVDAKSLILIPPMQFVTSSSTGLLDGEGERLGDIRQVYKAGNIHGVWIRTGTVTQGDDMKVSIQGVNTGGMPDGAILGAGGAGYNNAATIADANDNVWLGPFVLGADVPVTKGQFISVVIEYTAWTAGNSLNIANSVQSPAWYNSYTVTDQAATLTSGTLTVGTTYILYDFIAGDDFTNVGAASNADGVVFIATGTTPTTWTNGSKVRSWAKSTNGAQLSIILEYDDGTYDFGCVGAGAVGNPSVSSSTDPDEVGNRVTFPFPFRASGIWIYGDFDYDVTLELQADDGTVLANCTLDSDNRVGVAVGLFGVFFDAAPAATVNIAKDTYYRVIMRPGADAVAARYFDVPEADAMNAHHLGSDCVYTYRVDAGEWSQTTTRRLLIGLIADQLDDGAGTGGGGDTAPMPSFFR